MVGFSLAPIPWPIGKQGRLRFLVLFGDLAEAVRREAASVVRLLLGIGWSTVWE